MPQTALKHLAKKAKISLAQAEHYWHVSKNIVKKEYDVDENDGKFWALTMGITKKMMGLKEAISFKTFLEAAVGNDPTPTFVDESEVVNLIKKECSDSIWMLKQDRPFYKGNSYSTSSFAHDNGYGIVDSTATTRKSENTFNHYTVIFDHIESMKDFPKRSRSFIGSLKRSVSAGYGYKSHQSFDGSGSSRRPLIMLPLNGTKIGVVDDEDIWHTIIDLFGLNGSIEFWNEMFFSPLVQSDDSNAKTLWAKIVSFDKKLKANNSAACSEFTSRLAKLFDLYGAEVKSEEEIKLLSKKLLEEINRAYDPKHTGFRFYTTANWPRDLESSSEIWISGPLLLITESTWTQLRKKYGFI